jgi:hypothetical protein
MTPEHDIKKHEIVCFAGTRDCDPRWKYLIEREIRELDPEDSVVVGGCRGPDKWAGDYAFDTGHAVHVMEANWKVHGKSAGPKRNRCMAEVSDRLVALWDGKSRGTKNCIEEFKRLQKPVLIISIPYHIEDLSSARK